ncbi:YeeE/YedE family protein [Erythrobacter mangrovi]|uniref:YeeE/YedE family protein n=1 Tax=Erythrobacter mangrovi TaxID=2739433 RepID=A0A7D4BUP1_9SPHN|nr:YeeE/YedE thiosulfate transporter family protein [Erythrobacter mangrovi]QKG71147.1 YeeE/YedE family protein [Erythrobacter mangrovi]
MTIAAFPNAMPIHGLVGGLLIGAAAAIFLLGSGRIAGVSGLFARATGIAPGRRDGAAALFILALIAGAALVNAISGPIEQTFMDNWPVLALGGAIVGFGTRMGSGCTSGHGVCGMSRLSPRSIAATLTFMVFGMLTVLVMRLIGLGG